MKKQNITSITLFALSCLILSTSIFAQTLPFSSLDTSFGNGGMQIIPLPYPYKNPFPYNSAVQSDGKILSFFTAGSFVSNSYIYGGIVRYNADGSIDQTFGSNGFLFVNWDTAYGTFGRPFAIAIQIVEGEERIVAAGVAPPASSRGSKRLRVERYLSNGALDGTFGAGGTTFVNAGYALAVAVQPEDQKILTVGDGGQLVRLNADGTLDTAFGSVGIANLPTGMQGWALAVQSNGRIIAAGSSAVKSATYLTVARFNTNGTLDDGTRTDSTKGDSFGTAGKTTVDFYKYFGRAFDVKVDSGDRIIAVGGGRPVSSTASENMIIARLTPNGQLDQTFNNGSGKTTLDISGFQDDAKSVGLQPDGKIVVFGQSDDVNKNKNFAVARFNDDGSLDDAFGAGGIVTTDFSGLNDFCYSGVLQKDAGGGVLRIAALGIAKIGSDNQIAAVGYLP